MLRTGRWPFSTAPGLDGAGFEAPSTKLAVSLIEAHGMELPLVVVTSPGELEVTALVWARSVLVTQDALDLVKAKAS